MAGGGMQDVELLEEGTHHPDLRRRAPDGADRFRGRVRRALAWARGHVRVVVAGAAALAVAAAVPGALDARAERALLAELAGHPGILLPLDDSLHVAWTSPATFEQSSFFLGQERSWLRDDVLVIWTQSWEDQSHRLQGIDAGSGAVRWELDLPSAPVPTSYVPYDPRTCVAPARPHGSGVVVCLVVGGWLTGPDLMVDTDGDGTEETASAEPGRVRVVALSARTGEPLVERDVERAASIAVVEGDVVLAEGDGTGADDATTRVTRLDPATGDEVWHADVPRAEGVGSVSVGLQVVDGQVAVSWTGATQLLSPENGTPNGDAIQTDQVWSSRGRLLAFPQEGSGTTRLEVVGSGVELDLGKDRYPAWVDTDDGSDPAALVLTGEDSLSVADLDSGEMRWVRWTLDRDPESWVSQRMVLGGRLVTASDDEVRALDLATGEELWSTDPPGWLHDVVVSDGHHLFLLEAGGDTGRVLAAYALADGARAWAVPVPNEINRLAVIEHRLFGIGADGITAFTTG